MKTMEDLTGKVFNRLKVISFAGKNKHRQLMWLCVCECGKEKIVRALCLRNGATQSCGCARSDISKKMLTTHGMRHTRIYNIWAGMKVRCNPRREHRWKHIYAGKGITYAAEWETFEGFYKDMGEGYSDELTLDRIDSALGYCKENCRWVTMREQNYNKCNNVLIEHDGILAPAAKHAMNHGISRSTFHTRRYVLGWSIDDALHRPLQKKTTKK